MIIIIIYLYSSINVHLHLFLLLPPTHLELWQSLDSFEGSEDTQDTQGFDGVDVFPFAASVERCWVRTEEQGKTMRLESLHCSRQRTAKGRYILMLSATLFVIHIPFKVLL